MKIEDVRIGMKVVLTKAGEGYERGSVFIVKYIDRFDDTIRVPVSIGEFRWFSVENVEEYREPEVSSTFKVGDTVTLSEMAKAPGYKFRWGHLPPVHRFWTGIVDQIDRQGDVRVECGGSAGYYWWFAPYELQKQIPNVIAPDTTITVTTHDLEKLIKEMVNEAVKGAFENIRKKIDRALSQ